jgi:serine/threonine-protein kinase
MEPKDTSLADREQRLDEAVTSYLRAVEAGRDPDRRQWLDRFPDLADELAEFFADREVVDRLASPLRLAVRAAATFVGVAETAVGPSPDSLPEGQARYVGDHELLAEIGQGGMGVVYRARQQSLHRLVALKVIRADRLDAPAKVRRFRNEAETVAALDHPHIVPVYEICETGNQLFFSMKLVEGGSLADRLKDFPADPQRAARLLVVVARAVHHAHQRGVLHRDLKPSNILLDAEGQPHVSDFGLAKRVAMDSDLTQSGALVGTPSYMAPEQASASMGGVTTATDVYGLGAVLYALLSGRPPFRGETVLDTLVLVKEAEPEPPGRLNPKVDRDLEAVCTKCLHKDPTRRYGSAEALAEDLERWLNGEPTVARPAGRLERLGRWARRHRVGVGVAAVLLVTTVLGGWTWLWWDHQRATAEGEAREALREATRFQKQEKWAEALSAVRRAQGVLTGIGANPALRQQADELGKDLEMARRLEEARFQSAAGEENGHFDWKASNAAYAKAFRWYGLDLEHFDPREAGERVRSLSIRSQLVAALDDWALLRLDLGIRSWKKLVAVARAADPDPLRNRLRDAMEGNRPRDLKKLIALCRSDEVQSATAVLLAILCTGTPAAKNAVVVMRKVRQRYPGDFWVNHSLAFLNLRMRPPHLEEAIRYFTAAVALRPQSPGSHLNLGSALEKVGRLDEAIDACREAIRLKPGYSGAHNNLGKALYKQGKVPAAEREFQRALALDPKNAQAQTNLGVALVDQGKLRKAERAFRRAIALDPKCALAHTNLGNALDAQGQYAKAMMEYRRAIALDPKYAVPHDNLGKALKAQGKLAKAVREYKRAIALDPMNASTHYRLGNALEAQGKLREAVLAYRQAIALNPKDAKAHNNLGIALYALGRLPEAVTAYRRAIALNGKDAIAHTNLGNALRVQGKVGEAVWEYKRVIALDPKFAKAHAGLGLALLSLGRFEEARQSMRQCLHLLPSDQPLRRFAAQTLHQCQQLLALDRKLTTILKGEGQPDGFVEQMNLARLCVGYKKRYAAAVRFFAAAFAAQPKAADDLGAGHRYYAACAAALAAAGKGIDAAKLDAKEKARLRGQALTWLRANLALRAKQLTGDKLPDRQTAQQALLHWQKDPDLAGVRGAALAKLPEGERKAWRQFWTDVEETLIKAQGKKGSKEKATQ